MTELPKKFSSLPARLRFIRSLSGLTRDDMAEKHAIPEATLRRWETGSIPLTTKGLLRCITAYKKENIVVTETWIKSGEGTRPFIAIDTNPNHYDQNDALEFFKRSLNNCIIYKVPDNSMLPRYLTNELVVGDVFIGDISRLHNLDCVILLEDETTLLRKVIYTNENNITFICTNPSVTSNPALYNAKTKYIAPVLWHQISN